MNNTGTYVIRPPVHVHGSPDLSASLGRLLVQCPHVDYFSSRGGGGGGDFIGK